MVPGVKSNSTKIDTFIFQKEKEYGLTISLIQYTDALFIWDLRNNPKAQLLNGTAPSVEQQIAWIQDYKIREDREQEFYFIFWSNSERIGTIRFIRIDESTFESGSWLFIDNIPFSISVKAELFCKDFAFELYTYKKCFFYMSRKNKQVIRYHKMFNPKLVKEDSDNLYFILTKEDYYLNKDKILSHCRD